MQFPAKSFAIIGNQYTNKGKICPLLPIQGSLWRRRNQYDMSPEENTWSNHSKKQEEKNIRTYTPESVQYNSLSETRKAFVVLKLIQFWSRLPEFF